MYVVSVSKSWKHRGKYIKHRPNTKKYWRIMYLERDYDDELKLRSKFVNSLEALYYKSKKVKLRKFLCPECFNVFLGFVKNDRTKVECPYCHSIETNE